MTKCDLGFCTLAGTQLSDSAAATGKDGRPTVGKPRQLKLLGGQLVAVDENQTARVERHRPSARGANYTITDIHCLPRQIAEILDHSAADLAVRPRIHTHPHIHRHVSCRRYRQPSRERLSSVFSSVVTPSARL